jgi:REP element-mobilizing transposase RayT
MARGVDRREIFTDDRDRINFMQSVRALKIDMGFSLLAYCLMGNHFHLAIGVRDIALSKIMQRLLTTYVIGFNARHSRQGHLFQARYKAILCVDDAYLIALVRYIHLNPVRAGLVLSPSDWSWSSHQAYAERKTTILTDMVSFWDAFGGAGLGDQDFPTWSGQVDQDFKPWPEADLSQTLLRRVELDVQSLDSLAAELLPEETAKLRSHSRRSEVAKTKLKFAEKAVQKGHSQSSIARWMGCTPSGIHRLLFRNKSKSQSLTPTF